MIELTDKTVGLWFIALVPGTSDWMGALESTDEGFQFTYRFRYYVDVEPQPIGESEDVSKWYHWTMTAKGGKPQPTQLQAIGRVQFVIDELENMSGQKADVIMMGDGGVDRFGKDLQAAAWTRTALRGQVLPFEKKT